MIKSFAAKLGAVLLSGTTVFSAAYAQEIQNQWTDKPTKAKVAQIFLVSVEGVLQKDSDSNRLTKSEGVAFAISPNQLITARHVTGDDKVPGTILAYAPLPNFQGLYIPNRKITLGYDPSEDVTNHPTGARLRSDLTTTDVISRPASDPQIDAVMLDFRKLGINADPFELSACSIDDMQSHGGEDFFVWKFYNLAGGSPPTSVDDIISTRIRFAGRSGFGTLMEFDNVGQSGDKFAIVPGDSGSPVLNSQGKVVGLVSAVSKDDVYVTLISSMLDLIPPEIEVECAENRVNPLRFQALLDRVNQLEAEFAEDGRIDKVEQELPELKTDIETAQTAAEAAQTTGNNAQKAANNAQGSADNAQDAANLANASAIASLQAIKEIPEGLRKLTQDNEKLTQMGEIFEQFGSSDLKILPTLRILNTDLTTPFWEATLKSVVGKDKVKFTERYTRSVRSRSFDKVRKYCITPVHPKPAVDDEEDFGRRPFPTNKAHYRLLDIYAQGNVELFFEKRDNAYKDLLDAGVVSIADYPQPECDHASHGLDTGEGFKSYEYEVELPLINDSLKSRFGADWHGTYFIQVLVSAEINGMAQVQNDVSVFSKIKDWTVDGHYMVQVKSEEDEPKCYRLDDLGSGGADGAAIFVQNMLNDKEFALGEETEGLQC